MTEEKERKTSSCIDKIAVIIVNYGTPELTIAGVNSVLEQQHGGRVVDVHVVDNASPDDSAAQLQAAYAEHDWGNRVTLYLETENHGFGRGNNVVLMALQECHTPPDAVFLLNPDARVKPETLNSLADFMDGNPSVSLCGCRIERPDGTAVTAAFHFPTVFGEFLTGLGLGRISQFFPTHVVALPANIETGPVDWVSGAAFMARFDILREVGFFDPDFFLYFEETELMFRLREKDHEIWHLRDACIVHVAGAATGMSGGQARSGTRPAYWYESWVLYYLKTKDAQGALRAAFARRCGLRLNKFISALRGRKETASDHERVAFSKQQVFGTVEKFSGRHSS